MPASDEKIAKAVQMGDIDAFGELISRYEPKLQRYARRFLNRSEEIDDTVQDVFIKAYTNIQSFDPTLSFSPWIYRIAHNLFVNELRRKERVGLIFDADSLLPNLSAKESADDLVLGKERIIEMESALATLPAKYREVVQLYYFDEFSYQEISDILKIPITTIGVRLKRAREKIEVYYKNQKAYHE
jgi:RNA polymerase sigma-70 factor (ECF subfamily)